MIAHYMSIGNGPASVPIFTSIEQIHSNLEPTLKSVYIFVFFLILGLTFPKISICCLYLRLFSGKITRTFTWILIILAILMGIAFTLAGFFLCSPIPFYWDKLLPGGHCGDLNAYYRAFGLPNIIIDVGIIVVPLPAIWKVHMPIGKKLGLTIIFLTGIL